MSLGQARAFTPVAARETRNPDCGCGIWGREAGGWSGVGSGEKGGEHSLRVWAMSSSLNHIFFNARFIE